MNVETYTLPAELLQAIVNHLNQQPAGAVRPLLNAIEVECVRQDRARAEADAEKQLAELRAKAAAELQKAVQG